MLAKLLARLLARVAGEPVDIIAADEQSLTFQLTSILLKQLLAE